MDVRARDTLTRRLRTVPAIYLGLVLVVALLPPLVVVATLVDVVRWQRTRTPWMALRILAFGILYLVAEVTGVTALVVSWVVAGFGRAHRRLHTLTFSIQRWWAGVVFRSVRTIFRLRFHAEGLDSTHSAPYLLFARHASIVDNLLPAWFISRPGRTHIRYVMKRELLWDPALDIAGNRLPNYFVRRGAGDSDGEIAAIRRLAEEIGADEALLIYPEGTRFTPEKLRRARDRVARGASPLAARAARLRTVLPPRLGGPLALLDACRADVVVMAHRGLDGFARVADIWSGAMVGRQVDVLFRRIPRTDIPELRSERAEWLFGLWVEMDDWIAGPATATA